MSSYLYAPPTYPLTVVYATDEHVAIRCSGDYRELVPKDQVDCQGLDGTISVAKPWLLTSATINFQTCGIVSGQVITFLENDAEEYGPGSSDYAIDSVLGNTATLRRIGAPLGQGQSPGRLNQSAIPFIVRTFKPQIEDASFALNRKFTINPGSPFWGPDNLYDQRQLRQACVLTVLSRQYATQARGKDSEYWIKVKQCQDDLAEATRTLGLSWQRGIEVPAARSRTSVSIIR